MISYDLDLDPVGLPLQLNFIHKRVIRAATSFVTGGGVTGAIRSFASGGGGGGGRSFARGDPRHPGGWPANATNQMLRGSVRGGGGAAAGARAELALRGVQSPLALKPIGATFTLPSAPTLSLAMPSPSTARSSAMQHDPCPGRFNFELPNGSCFDPTKLPIGGAPPFTPGAEMVPAGDFGEAVQGRFGVALQPAQINSVRLMCPRGSVLGSDNLCYNRGNLARKDRKWIPGRKPLLTGGDLNAISRAARAARRMKLQTRRLQKLGMLEKPRPRKALPTTAAQHHAGG